MKVIKAEKAIIEEIIEIIMNRGIIIYPTETLYGIGVKYDDKELLKDVFRIKKRPDEKTFPLIIDLKHLELVTEFIPDTAQRLIDKYWPGPLTLLLPAKKGLPEEIVKDKKVAIRMPGESFALHLIKKLTFPITATSANISGLKPAETAEEAIEYFKYEKIDLIIDAGKLPGIPSTIVDVTETPPKILRKGSVELSFD